MRSLLLFVALGAGVPVARAAEPPQQPNVLFIVADDLLPSVAADLDPRRVLELSLRRARWFWWRVDFPTVVERERRLGGRLGLLLLTVWYRVTLVAGPLGPSLAPRPRRPVGGVGPPRLTTGGGVTDTALCSFGVFTPPPGRPLGPDQPPTTDALTARKGVDMNLARTHAQPRAHAPNLIGPLFEFGVVCDSAVESDGFIFSTPR